MGSAYAKKTNEEIKDIFDEQYSNDLRKSPYKRSWFFGNIMFSWVTPILAVSRYMPFEQSMHYQLNEDNKIQKQLEGFKKNWIKLTIETNDKIKQSEFELEKPNILTKAITRSYKWRVVMFFI